MKAFSICRFAFLSCSSPCLVCPAPFTTRAFTQLQRVLIQKRHVCRCNWWLTIHLYCVRNWHVMGCNVACISMRVQLVLHCRRNWHVMGWNVVWRPKRNVPPPPPSPPGRLFQPHPYLSNVVFMRIFFNCSSFAMLFYIQDLKTVALQCCFISRIMQNSCF